MVKNSVDETERLINQKILHAQYKGNSYRPASTRQPISKANFTVCFLNGFVRKFDQSHYELH